jgi:hypothetical protein
MRTKVTLDPDVAALIHRAMRERRITFNEALNQAVRAGMTSAVAPPAPFRTPTFRMGFEQTVPLDRALRLAADLEDEEVVRRLATRR